MSPEIKQGPGLVNISIRLDVEVKQMLIDAATKRGMDLSKLVRATLTNMVKPGTYSL